MPVWEKWREALKEGKTVGAIWNGTAPGAHLHNEVQRIDDNKVAAAAGNKHGSAWVKAYPDKVVVVFYGADEKEIRREEFATAPVTQVI